MEKNIPVPQKTQKQNNYRKNTKLQKRYNRDGAKSPYEEEHHVEGLLHWLWREKACNPNPRQHAAVLYRGSKLVFITDPIDSCTTMGFLPYIANLVYSHSLGRINTVIE